MTLKANHKYMSQVQAQICIAGVQYCDFVVWSPTEMFIQRIQFDDVFFSETYSTVVQFIKTRLLPELVGKYYTVPRTVVSQPQSNREGEGNKGRREAEGEEGCSNSNSDVL
ncbi:hypothetical protein GOODEAATRI_029438 [Goodea atripinnis]|uniref:Uncharacterized protein n=1 Tax=Goodea atripinnis TaxID=208336 RepID=A0ABV0N8E7_9TELE